MCAAQKTIGEPGLLAAFGHNVTTRPAAPAVVWRGTEFSYATLSALADAARVELDTLNLPPRTPIGVLARKSPLAIAVLLACLRTRRPFLLPPLDLGEQTLRTLFAQAGCATVVAVDADVSASHPTLVDHTVTGVAAAAPAVDVPGEPDDPAFLLTTSGSTGLPKIVPLPAGAVDRFTHWADVTFDLGAGRTALNHPPLNFDLCLLDIWATLAGGGRVVLVEADQSVRAGHLVDLIDRYQVNVVQGVPMLYHLLTGQDRQPVLPSVDRVILTGDHYPRHHLPELTTLFPNARLFNVYGCTETNDSFLHEIDPDAAGPIPIGTPVAGTRALLVEPDGAVLTGAGLGELHVRTPFQAKGYLNPELDADRFVPHTDADGAHRYFRTGDLVCRHADGRLTLEGRRDFQVKVRGTRVNTEQVEQALLRHPDVVEAVVLAPPDPVAGHRLHAVVRRDDGSALNSLALRRHCAAELPAAAIPSLVDFTDEPLPRTSTGKPDRRQVAATYLGDR